MIAQREETKLIATPYEVIWEEMAYEDIEDSSGWNGYILLILSIGMPLKGPKWLEGVNSL